MPQTSIAVRVQPRARTDELVEVRGDVLLIRVSAPPLDGRANDAVCRVLAQALGIKPSKLRIVRGERARDKVVMIEGLDAGAVKLRLGWPPDPAVDRGRDRG